MPVIDLYYQFTTKLGAHCTRRANGGTNDYTDLDFLVRQEPEQIFFMRDYLDVGLKRAFYTDFAAINDPVSTAFLSQTPRLSQDAGGRQM